MRRIFHGLKIASLCCGICLLSACDEGEPPERAFAEPGLVDGKWTVVEIDGRPLARDDIYLTIERNEITGGFDGCNHWGFDRSGPRPLVVSDAMACPDDPLWPIMQTLQKSDQRQISVRFGEPNSGIRTPEHTFLIFREPA